MSKATAQPLGWVKFWKPTDDWYYLEPASRQAYLDSYGRCVARATERGARLLGTYKCRGQSRWARFEVWEFPDVQVIIDFTNDLEEVGHYQYFAEENTVGRRYERTGNAETWVI
ncbi:MAG TPA: hypothetical protein DEP84_04090 [Chloroflexi bacterium]|nr:hypothetical protein [Chloroflexota bacterium]